MMRFADFVVALPFLLFMILFKVIFGIGPGESGIWPMLVAMIILLWPAPARLVRGQILQIREEGYVSASRLLGGTTSYVVGAPYVAQYPWGNIGHHDLSGPQRDFHRSFSVFYRHGGRTANAVLGRHV